MKSKDFLDEPINWNHAVYALGKLTDVIVILVEGEGDVRSRLHQASPRLIRVKPHMLPAVYEIREKVEWVYSTLTKFHDPDEFVARPPNLGAETIFHGTLRRIKNRTGSKVAGKLFSAWMDLSNLCEQHFREQ